MTVNQQVRIEIDATELETGAAYVKALEERVMQLEAKLVQMGAEIESAEIKAELRAEGYVSGPPGFQAALVDKAACIGSTCEKCGNLGLRYDPYIRRDPKGYRAFSVCPKCGDRVEF